MVIGERLKAIRIHKGMSQGDVEQRSGLVRAYVSRVENGHLTPTLDTLEKFGRALKVPVYQLFYEDKKLFRATTVKRDTRRVTKKEMRLMTHLRRGAEPRVSGGPATAAPGGVEKWSRARRFKGSQRGEDIDGLGETFAYRNVDGEWWFCSGIGRAGPKPVLRASGN